MHGIMQLNYILLRTYIQDLHIQNILIENNIRKYAH